jgi:hypothetical protein
MLSEKMACMRFARTILILHIGWFSLDARATGRGGSGGAERQSSDALLSMTSGTGGTEVALYMKSGDLMFGPAISMSYLSGDNSSSMNLSLAGQALYALGPLGRGNVPYLGGGVGISYVSAEVSNPGVESAISVETSSTDTTVSLGGGLLIFMNSTVAFDLSAGTGISSAKESSGFNLRAAFGLAVLLN